MKRIPIGISDFKKLRDGDYLYVDKTKDILNLVTTQDYAFFSRPRRFGKSLTLDVVETLFSKGIEPYFKDTYIGGLDEDGTLRWNEPTYPVIRLDFSNNVKSTIAEFRKQFCYLINELLKAYGIEPYVEVDMSANILRSAVKDLANKFDSRVVLLIDEYDAPLNDLIDNSEAFDHIRKEIREIYAAIKASDVSGKLRFMLVTGITRFKDASLFSAGTNITDISYDPNFSTIVGYTRNEIEHYFKDYIDIAIEKLNNCKLSELTDEKYILYKTALLDKLADYYDNICFDEYGEQTVYSTWSVSNFFDRAYKRSMVEFGDYWYDNGGMPTILVKYLKNHLIDFSPFNDDIKVTRQDFKGASSLQGLNQNVLMTQTGYLTLKKGTTTLKNMICLTIPNLELRKALANLTVSNVFGSYFNDVCDDLGDDLNKANAEQVFSKFNEILAKIPRTHERYNFRTEHEVKTVIQMFLLGANIDCYREVSESKGFPDLVIELSNRIIVVEFKYTANTKEVPTLLENGCSQVVNQNYGASFDCNKPRLRMAVVYDANSKLLADYKEC